MTITIGSGSSDVGHVRKSRDLEAVEEIAHVKRKRSIEDDEDEDEVTRKHRSVGEEPKGGKKKNHY